MKKLIRLALFFIMFLLTFNDAWSFEIQWPINEQGFFVGQEFLYNKLTKTGNEEGVFIFGQGKEIINGIEYYDCLFTTATTQAHFLFHASALKQALILKEIDTGNGKIEIIPFATFLGYPLFDGAIWQEKGIKIIGTNIPVPDFGVLPTLTVEDVKAEAIVSKSPIDLPAGLFEALLARVDYIGNVMNVPMVLVQRVWVSEGNIFLKINFELKFFSKTMPIFDMEFVSFSATALSLAEKKSLTWGFLKD